MTLTLALSQPKIITRARVGIAANEGQDESHEGVRSTRAVVARLRQKIDALGLERLVLHPFSTRSHCKLLIADDGSPERLTACVGSCNWLSSGFTSFEASVRLRDSGIVADVLDQLAELSRGSNGHWTELTNDLVALASNLRAQRRHPSGRARASIVLSGRHAEFIRMARDESKSRTLYANHT